MNGRRAPTSRTWANYRRRVTRSPMQVQGLQSFFGEAVRRASRVRLPACPGRTVRGAAAATPRPGAPPTLRARNLLLAAHQGKGGVGLVLDADRRATV